MGLFDSYFDPSTYQGSDSGSLIDRLLAQLGTQGQYEPSQGFPQSPMDASASMDNAKTAAANVQPQNAPIAVGDYMMPRIGSGFPGYPQHDPQTGETVQPAASPSETNNAARSYMATRAQTAQPLQPAMPPQLQPFGTGLGGHLIAGAQNFAHAGGLLPALVNGITGLATGQRTDSEGLQAAYMRAQYESLLHAGVPEPQARLAAVDPEYRKEIAKQFGPHAAENLGEGWIRDPYSGKVTRAFQPEQKDNYAVVQSGEDGLGRKTFVKMNKATGVETPMKSALTGADDNGGGLGNMALSGKEYLASLPKKEANIVQGMAEGTIAPPSSFALAKPYWQNMVSAAKNYDPTFDSTNWSGRVAGAKDFSAGKSSEMVRSANQTIGHIGDLIDKMDALNNGQYPYKNAAGNFINNKILGVTGVTGFKQNAHAVADELSKVFKGAGISDHEIKQWEESLSENMSPAQQREAVTTAMGLLQHSLSALEEKRLNSIGPVAAEKAGPLLKPDAQAAVERIQKWAAQGGDKPAATTRTGVKWSVE